MIALELTDIKNFMNKLLRSEVFDHFLLQEALPYPSGYDNVPLLPHEPLKHHAGNNNIAVHL